MSDIFYGRTANKALECTDCIDISTQDIQLYLRTDLIPSFSRLFYPFIFLLLSPLTPSFQSCTNFFSSLKEISPSEVYLLVPFPIGYHSNGGHTQQESPRAMV
jgi:hypothetical protein